MEEEQTRGGKTLEDYLALPEGTPIEMIDGVFYDRTSSTSIHARISMKISQAFENFITQNHGKCIPFVAPVDVQLDCDDKTMVVPDLFVVCDRNKRLYPWVVGAPDLIVEVNRGSFLREKGKEGIYLRRQGPSWYLGGKV